MRVAGLALAGDPDSQALSKLSDKDLAIESRKQERLGVLCGAASAKGQVATVVVEADTGGCFDHHRIVKELRSMTRVSQDLWRSCGHLAGIVRWLASIQPGS